MNEFSRKKELKTKFKPLRFGTSGIRAKISDMTDMECYINTRGFIKYLKKEEGLSEKNAIAFAGDLRSSTPRIMKAVNKAIMDERCEPINCGFVPTPCLSLYAWERNIPGIMVTGSHIPDDRNGIKFIKSQSEVLKEDEKKILAKIEKTREEEYKKTLEESDFNMQGLFKKPRPKLINEEQGKAEEEYKQRYLDIFPKNILAKKKVVLYEQSAVGRDLLREILTSLSAEVITIQRSNEFIPIDTEKISNSLLSSLSAWAQEHKPFAIISTDGDSDRPLLTDENGAFLPGDLLGTLVSIYIKPEFVSVPVSTNHVAIKKLEELKTQTELTKIGSPYCIKSMNKKLSKNPTAKISSWERNGGYLLGSDFEINEKRLKSLPTRDAILPLLIALIFAIESKLSISELIKKYIPDTYNLSTTIDDKTPGCEKYTSQIGKEIIKKFSTPNNKKELENYFNSKLGYTEIKNINTIDGLRIQFDNEDIVHLRPSSNAPEFRIYITSYAEKRAQKMLRDRLTILPKIIKDLF